MAVRDEEAQLLKQRILALEACSEVNPGSQCMGVSTEESHN